MANNGIAGGALLSIQRLLDDGGIPRGTFADDQVRNLVALYNRRGTALIEAREALDKCWTGEWYPGNEDFAEALFTINEVLK